jgi:hypothetical protein
MDRRGFASILGSVALAPFWGCQRGESDYVALARTLGLSQTELGWLDTLPPDRMRELRNVLEQPGHERTEIAVDLVFSLIGDRSRTFAFVGYPALPDRRSVCDGLLAE